MLIYTWFVIFFQTKKLLRKRDELITSNKDQAVTNMSLEPEIKLLKENIVELARQQNELKDKHVQLQQRLGEFVVTSFTCFNFVNLFSFYETFPVN